MEESRAKNRHSTVFPFFSSPGGGDNGNNGNRSNELFTFRNKASTTHTQRVHTHTQPLPIPKIRERKPLCSKKKDQASRTDKNHSAQHHELVRQIKEEGGIDRFGNIKSSRRSANHNCAVARKHQEPRETVSSVNQSMALLRSIRQRRRLAIVFLTGFAKAEFFCVCRLFFVLFLLASMVGGASALFRRKSENENRATFFLWWQQPK